MHPLDCRKHTVRLIYVCIVKSIFCIELSNPTHANQVEPQGEKKKQIQNHVHTHKVSLSLFCQFLPVFLSVAVFRSRWLLFSESQNSRGSSSVVLVQLPYAPFTFWWCNTEWWFNPLPCSRLYLLTSTFINTLTTHPNWKVPFGRLLINSSDTMEEKIPIKLFGILDC